MRNRSKAKNMKSIKYCFVLLLLIAVATQQICVVLGAKHNLRNHDPVPIVTDQSMKPATPKPLTLLSAPSFNPYFASVIPENQKDQQQMMPQPPPGFSYIPAPYGYSSSFPSPYAPHVFPSAQTNNNDKNNNEKNNNPNQNDVRLRNFGPVEYQRAFEEAGLLPPNINARMPAYVLPPQYDAQSPVPFVYTAPTYIDNVPSYIYSSLTYPQFNPAFGLQNPFASQIPLPQPPSSQQQPSIVIPFMPFAGLIRTGNTTTTPTTNTILGGPRLPPSIIVSA